MWKLVLLAWWFTYVLNGTPRIAGPYATQGSCEAIRVKTAANGIIIDVSSACVEK